MFLSFTNSDSSAQPVYSHSLIRAIIVCRYCLILTLEGLKIGGFYSVIIFLNQIPCVHAMEG